MIFDHRTAVVTGAAGRIGQGTARKFAQYGVKLYLADIDMERLDAFAAELRSTGADVHTVFMDVSDLTSITTAAETILQDAARVDILVNNAGVWPRATALESSDDAWQKTINLNLNSVFRLSKIFGQKMKEQNYGRIVNLGSIAGEAGLPEMCAYSVAKAGVIMLTKTMAMELAKCGVTVNCVSPGAIERDGAKWAHMTYMGEDGHAGAPRDIAETVLFLAHQDYITGENIVVDGGRSLGPSHR